MTEIVAVALVCAVIIIYLRNINSELAFLATIVASIIVVSYALSYLTSGFSLVNEIIELTGVDRELYVIIFKITAIGYIVEFGADTINDFGLKSLADKLILVGKLIIFSVSMPIIYAVLNLLKGLLQ